MNVYDVKTVFGTTTVVADSMAEAERIHSGKYWPTKPQKIELHAENVLIQNHDEQPRQRP